MDQGGEAAGGRRAIAREVASLTAAGALALLLALSAATAVAQAETISFGGNPAGEVTPGLSCASDIQPFVGTETCAWVWIREGVGSDEVPFPDGGSGTVTSVTLPAMPEPGPMETIVIRSLLESTGSLLEPFRTYCCQIAEIGPEFTVPANQVTTVPLDLAVSNEAPPNHGDLGPYAHYDYVGIAVLSPTASLPVRYTGNTIIGDAPDRDKLFLPAPSALSEELIPPPNPYGYEMMASFTISTAGATTPPATPTPTTSTATPTSTLLASALAPEGGLKLGTRTLTTANLAGPLTIGQAENPPTASTTQTLTVPGAAAAVASHGKSKSKPKPIVIGRGTTIVPGGHTVALKLTLTSAGRKLLGKKHSLKVTETIVAKNTAGQTETTTRTVTIKLKRK